MTISAFLDNALHAIADSFTPLSNAFADADSFRDFLAGFGWELDPAVDDAQFAIVGQIFGAEKVLLDKLPGAEAAELAVAIPALVASLLRNRSPDPAWPTPLNSGVFWSGTPNDAAFPHELLDALLYDIVADRVPVGFGLLRFVGVFDEEARPAVPAISTIPDRAAYTRRVIDWSRLGPAISHPESIFETVYHWNGVGGTFEHAKLLRNIGALFEGFPLGVAVVPTSTAARELYFDPLASSPASLDQLTVLPLSYHTASGPTFGSMKLSLNALPIPPAGTRTGQPVGIALFPLVSGQVQNSVTLSEGITATLSGAYATIPVLAEIRPAGVTFNVPQGAPGTLNAEARVDAHAGVTSWLLLGSADATRLELSRAHLSFKAQGALTDPEFTIEVGIDSAAVVVDFGEGDSFLQRMFGDEAQRTDLALAIAWSNKTGFRVGGQVRLEVSIPIHQTILGAITLDTISLVLRADAMGRSILEVAVSGSFALGPIKATVDRVGLMMTFVPANGGPSNLGLVNLNLGFRPPNGLGLVVAAGPVTGGGFLFIDTANGRYAGVLQLSIADKIAITAIGLLDTKLPGGKKGFSFLIIITAKFPPIQLGFGFALTGLGGLAGIHRSIVAQALQDGVRNRSLGHILFPEDPVKNAPKLISDLQAIFPPTEGQYVFGPMASLVWGTPTVIEAELGIILQLPDPIRLIILGQVNVVLPDKQAAVIELHLDIVGIIDFTNKNLSLDASLHDSRLAVYNLYGDMAMRLSWGDPPNFALSVGGLHPQFQPPPNFPMLKRLTVALGLGENPRFSLQAYLAVTSNTVQFGALAELYAEAAGFNVYGWIGFDVLFIFTPFSLTADFSAGVALRQGSTLIASVHLAATLTGPTPWHAWGEASISILLVSITVSFDATFGEEPQQLETQPADPWVALKAEIEKTGNWSATLPPASSQVVSLVAPAKDEPGLALIDPLGGLTLRQKVVPFDRTLTKFGQGSLAPSQRFNLDQVKVGASVAQKGNALLDYFAPGQFEEMTDAEKLSRPSFEQMQAGTTIASDAVTFGAAKGTDYTYKTVIIDAPDLPPRELKEPDGKPIKYTLKANHQMAALQRSAAAQSPLRTTGLDKFAPPPSEPALVMMGEEEYVIVDTTSLADQMGSIKQEGIFIPEPKTKGAVYQVLAEYLTKHPKEKGKLEVVPAHEV